ncbi:transposase [Streptomyces sp. NPDC020096]
MIVDSQSVKGAETVSNATRGCDANKHTNGRKRHLLVDQDGLLVDLLVTPADVQDRDAARILLTRLHAEHPEIVLVRADNGYGGEEFSTWAQDTLGITIKDVARPRDAKGFVLLPKRWVVERGNSSTHARPGSVCLWRRSGGARFRPRRRTTAARPTGLRAWRGRSPRRRAARLCAGRRRPMA